MLEERNAAGERWPQTARTLLDALRTFPAGRVWLTNIERMEARLATAVAAIEATGASALGVQGDMTKLMAMQQPVGGQDDAAAKVAAAIQEITE